MKVFKSVFLVLLLLLSTNIYANSNSNSLNQTQVSKLYVAIFNRASEGEGNSYWQSQGSMADVADKMLATPDAQTYFGSALDSDQAFIEWIYKNTLNKTYSDDPDGINYWTNLLNSGKSRGEVVAALVNAIDSYAPNGVNYDPNDSVTVRAYSQFSHRVEVSNYTANSVNKAPIDYKTKLGFDHNLNVSEDYSSVNIAKNFVNSLSNNNDNKPPVANAGNDQTINLGDTIYFDASGSYDTDGVIVSYKWSNGSNSYTTSNAYDSFAPTGLVLGNNIFTLTVTDDQGATATDTVNIIVRDSSNRDDELPDIKKK